MRRTPANGRRHNIRTTGRWKPVLLLLALASLLVLAGSAVAPQEDLPMDPFPPASGDLHEHEAPAKAPLERAPQTPVHVPDPTQTPVMLAKSTFVGSSDLDGGLDIAVDQDGNVYITGFTESETFPTTENAFQTEKADNLCGQRLFHVDTTGAGILPPVQCKSAFVAKVSPQGDLVYATYLGATGSDVGIGIDVDQNGYAYVAGETSSSEFPTTPNALLEEPQASPSVFLAKIDPTGEDLAYSTYLPIDLPSVHSTGALGGVVVDDDGYAHVLARDGNDVGVAKISPGGDALIYHTVFGGAAGEDPRGLAVDPDGNAYVTGETNSDDFPTTDNALQETQPSDNTAAFVTKLNPEGEIAYSTYLGGSQSAWFGLVAVPTRGWDIATDQDGYAYVTGQTLAADFPTTENAFQETYPGGLTSGFIAKLTPNGEGFVYSTYLGANAWDRIQGIDVADDGTAYVGGDTISRDFPVQGAIQPAHPGGAESGFVTQIDADGQGIGFSTYLGGPFHDFVRGGPVVDKQGDVHVTGITTSTTYPTTPTAYQPVHPGGICPTLLFAGPEPCWTPFVTTLTEVELLL